MASVTQESDKILVNQLYFAKALHHNSYVNGFEMHFRVQFIVRLLFKVMKFQKCELFLTNPYYLTTIVVK